jgi:hypothetical protein
LGYKLLRIGSEEGGKALLFIVVYIKRKHRVTPRYPMFSGGEKNLVLLFSLSAIEMFSL